MPKSYQDLIDESLKEVALHQKSYANLVSSALSAQSVSNTRVSSEPPSKERVLHAVSVASTIHPIPGCPEPGRLPYRHDPVKTYLQYEKAWRDQPSPGTKPHEKLRWELRKSLL